MAQKIRQTRKDIFEYLHGSKSNESGSVKVVVTYHVQGSISSVHFSIPINKNWLKMTLDLCRQNDIDEIQILQIVRTSRI
jgi:hypothetical protein